MYRKLFEKRRGYGVPIGLLDVLNLLVPGMSLFIIIKTYARGFHTNVLRRGIDSPCRPAWRLFAINHPPGWLTFFSQEADIKSQMQDCILGTGGELSALLRAANLGATYLQLDPQGRLNFQLVMVENFGPNGAQTEAAMETFRSDPQEAMIPP
jgi:hypothetical protein